MTEDAIAGLDFDVEWTCEMGERGFGHEVRAVALFRFRCVTYECKIHPEGPVEDEVAVCGGCLREVERLGLDCLRCGEFYRCGNWEWSKATRVLTLVMGPEPREPA